MKYLITATLTTLVSTSTFAFESSNYDPKAILTCPLEKTELVEVIKFIPSASADSNSTDGTCYVKVNYYSWWHLINYSSIPDEVEIKAGECNSSHFQNYNNKLFIAAEISYLPKVSKCGSNPGCHYECKPHIELFSF